MTGILVIDKPTDMTSRQVVNVAQRWFPRRTRIGHAGTLDPLATGVLVLCIGAATKRVEQIQNMGKTYRTRILLGFRSDSDDADGTLSEVEVRERPTIEQVRGGVSRFVGEISQVPPRVSAVKVDGKRAYDLARRGREIELTARTVCVKNIQMQSYEWPHLDLEIDCGKGTYIRSVARDLGEMLGCGGLVQTLRRTRVGCFHVEKACRMDTTTPMQARTGLLPESILDAPPAHTSEISSITPQGVS